MKCQACGETDDDLEILMIGKKKRRLCETCAEEAKEELELGAEAESAMQSMMEYRGR